MKEKSAIWKSKKVYPNEGLFGASRTNYTAINVKADSGIQFPKMNVVHQIKSE